MARNRQQRRYTAEEAQVRKDWFASVDSNTEQIADWDLKDHLLSAAVLQTLAMGSAIMFGVSLAGDAVSVTVYVGDTKHRKWVTDTIELEDYLALIVQRARAQTGGENIRQIGEAAD